MNNSITYKLSENIYIEEVGKKDRDKIIFILDPDRPSWVFINEDGLRILKLCNGKNTVEEISKIIANKYNKIKHKDSYEIVSSFIKHMKSNQILYSKPKNILNSNKFNGIALEITRKCNLRCVHCYLSAGNSQNGELTFEEIKKILKSTKEAGGISVALGGGEPLLRDDCIDIIEYATSLDLLISLGTNGTLINKKLAKLLSMLPIKIQVSLDGANKDINDKIRGEGSYNLTELGINNLINEGKAKDIVIAFTPMKHNINDIPYIIDFALERQIPVIQFPPLTSSGRAKKRWDELSISSSQKLQFWKFVSEKSEELKGELDLLADCFSININRIGTSHRCTIGTQFRIDPEGFVYPCQCFHFGSEYCIGNVKENNLKDIVYGQKIKTIKRTCFNRPNNIEECRECLWVNICGSGCMGNAFENSGTILQSESCEVRKKWIEKLFEAKLQEFRSSG